MKTNPPVSAAAVEPSVSDRLAEALRAMHKRCWQHSTYYAGSEQHENTMAALAAYEHAPSATPEAVRPDHDEIAAKCIGASIYPDVYKPDLADDGRRTKDFLLEVIAAQNDPPAASTAASASAGESWSCAKCGQMNAAYATTCGRCECSYAARPAAPVIAPGEPVASSRCPICGIDKPHAHSDAEVARYRGETAPAGIVLYAPHDVIEHGLLVTDTPFQIPVSRQKGLRYDTPLYLSPPPSTGSDGQDAMLRTLLPEIKHKAQREGYWGIIPMLDAALAQLTARAGDIK